MYARGMTMREIQGFLLRDLRHRGLAGVHQQRHRRGDGRSHGLAGRPLEPMYPVVFFDALRVKIKEDAVVRNKAIYLALGVLPDGSRDILGCGSRAPRAPSSG
jgi:putative transposase